jgi:hypothetical protein
MDAKSPFPGNVQENAMACCLRKGRGKRSEILDRAERSTAASGEKGAAVMDEQKGTGEVYIDIELTGEGPVFTEKANTTNGAVVFLPQSPAIGTFELKANLGTYTFFFEALHFEFAVDAVTFESDFHRNLAWVRPTDDTHVVAMSDLNFVTVEQIVDFFLNPSEAFRSLFAKPIDPTIINNPDPPAAAAQEGLRKAVAA